MKARGIVLIDYTFPNGFIEAAEEQKKLEEAIKGLTAGNRFVMTTQVDIRERRGDNPPDIKRLKLRTT